MFLPAVVYTTYRALDRQAGRREETGPGWLIYLMNGCPGS